MKTKYEKELEEFFGLEDTEESYVRYFSEEEDFDTWKEFFQEHMGNEFKHVENHRAAQKRLDDISNEVMEEYKDAFKELSKRNNVYRIEDFESYNRDKLGRFGMLKDGTIVEITNWTEEPEFPEDYAQEIYFKYLDNEDSTSWADFHDFILFAHSKYDLEDNPIKFGDKVMLKDINVSMYFELELDQQENYHLYLHRVGLITKVLDQEHMCAIAYDRDVILMPIFLIQKLYGREIF
jgi:hypothetical protein